MAYRARAHPLGDPRRLPRCGGASRHPEGGGLQRGDNEGCGYFHVNQKTGIRWNTSKAFLRPVRHRRNLEVETHAFVQRLTLDGKRVTGLVMGQHGSSAR